MVSKSVSSIEQIFDVDGKTLNQDVLDDYFSEFGNWFVMCKLNHSKISRELCVTRKTIIGGLNKLEELGYIKYDYSGDWEIYISRELLRNGYFELCNNDFLKGELLIFYSYLVNKSEKYGYCIDTFKSKIADDFGKTKVSITKLLNRLYKRGFAERLDNGKLLIK